MPKELGAAAESISRGQLDRLKKGSDEFPAFVLDLVAFDVPFGHIVALARENGFLGLNETKLYELVQEHFDLVLEKRSEFIEERLKYLILESTSVVPELKSLYEEAKIDFQTLKNEGRHKDAVAYLSNLVSIQSNLGKLQETLKEAESSIKLNIVTHGDINLRVMERLQDSGAIVINDPTKLKKELGFEDKPASFIEQFRETES